MIKIVRSHEQIEVKNIIATFYANPGVGKTSLAYTTESPLLLDFDRGAYRAKNRKETVVIESWQDVASMSREDIAGFKTVIIDTAGRALDCLAADIIKRQPKMNRGAGALSLQGYGALKAEFSSWLKHVKSFGVDIVMLAHSSEGKSGDDIIMRIDAQGSSKDEIYKVSDMMGYLSIIEGKIMLNCNPADVAFGKNPGIPVLQFPHPAENPVFLAEVISMAKDSLNRMSVEQAALMTEMEEWRDKFTDADAEELNKLIPQVSSASPAILDTIKRMMVKIAESSGITFDKATKQFVPPVTPTETTQADSASTDRPSESSTEPPSQQ
jgi:hypothetical protein